MAEVNKVEVSRTWSREERQRVRALLCADIAGFQELMRRDPTNGHYRERLRFLSLLDNYLLHESNEMLEYRRGCGDFSRWVAYPVT